MATTERNLVLNDLSSKNNVRFLTDDRSVKEDCQEIYEPIFSNELMEF
jgi:hypothetical protein